MNFEIDNESEFITVSKQIEKLTIYDNEIVNKTIGSEYSVSS